MSCPESDIMYVHPDRQPVNMNEIKGAPHIPITINGITILAMIDTGAAKTLCKTELMNQLFGESWTENLVDTQTSLHSATGNPLKVHGGIKLNIDIGGKTFTHLVTIVEAPIKSFLIGQDLIYERFSIIKGKSLVVEETSENPTRIHIPIKYNIKDIRVQTIQDETIPANSYKVIRCKLSAEDVNTDMTGETLIIEDNELSELRFTEDVIATVEEDNYILCLYKNDTDEPHELDENTIIALANRVDEGEDAVHFIQYTEEETEEKTTEDINLLHEEESRNIILHGSPEGTFPPPKGYEMGETSDKTVNIDEVKTSGIDEVQKQKLIKLLKKYRPVFSKGPGDFGKTPLMKFNIDTGDTEPIAARYIPVPAKLEGEVRKNLEEMLNNKIIEQCESPWNSSLVVVKKPNGKLRICVNLKNVNSVTLNTTAFPINYQEQSYAKLCNGKFFFRLDLSQAYYAIPLATEEDRNKTAFSALGRQYRFITSPYGAKLLPAKFNKLMAMVFDQMDHFLYFYFDDAIAACDSFDQLTKRLDQTLDRLTKANLRVNFQKSEFCLTNLNDIKWLGAVIRNNEVHPDPEKVKVIKEIPLPKDKNGILRFLGMVSYHRRHLPHLSETAAPLYKMATPKAIFHWGTAEKQAFEKTKELITSAKALALPNMEKPFIVTTDASDIGVGGVLSQKDDKNEEKIIAYCSRLLTANEQNCASCEKELMGILYAVTVFQYYLVNNKFTLRSDSRSLVYLRYLRNMNSKLFRASMHLDELDFDIEHAQINKGDNLMMIADMLSRVQVETGEEPPKKASYKQLRNPVFNKLTAPPGMPDDESVGMQEFIRMCDNYLKDWEKENQKEIADNKYQKPQTTAKQLIETIEEGFVNIITDEHDFIRMCEEARSKPDTPGILHIRQKRKGGSDGEEKLEPISEASVLIHKNVFTTKEFARMQEEDEEIKKIRKGIDKNKEKNQESDYVIKAGIIKFKDKTSGKELLVIPQAIRTLLIEHYHGANMGPHVGRKRLQETMGKSFAWRGMATDIMKYTKDCPICQYNTKNTNPQAILQRIYTPSGPNEVVNMDIVGPLPASTEGFKYALTIQDDFSKYVLAFPLRTKGATNIAKTLVKYWIIPFGPPKCIKSDEGTDVDSALVQYVCKMLQIDKWRTPIYSPQANPIERWHSTMAQALRSWLPPGKRRYWADILPFIATSYNHTVNTVTKFMPAELFLGHPTTGLLPPLIPEDHPALGKHEFLKQLREAQKVHWQIARENIERDREKRKPKLDKEKEVYQYKVGDHVLVRNFAPTDKLQNRWEGPYVVIDVKHNALSLIKWHHADNLKEQGGKLIERTRLRQEPKMMGAITRRIVHPKDVKLWKGKVQKHYTWDQVLAKKFFKRILGSIPKTAKPGEDKSSQGTSESKILKPKEETDTSSDDDDSESSSSSSSGDEDSNDDQDQRPHPDPQGQLERGNQIWEQLRKIAESMQQEHQEKEDQRKRKGSDQQDPIDHLITQHMDAEERIQRLKQREREEEQREREQRERRTNEELEKWSGFRQRTEELERNQYDFLREQEKHKRIIEQYEEAEEGEITPEHDTSLLDLEEEQELQDQEGEETIESLENFQRQLLEEVMTDAVRRSPLSKEDLEKISKCERELEIEKITKSLERHQQNIARTEHQLRKERKLKETLHAQAAWTPLQTPRRLEWEGIRETPDISKRITLTNLGKFLTEIMSKKTAARERVNNRKLFETINEQGESPTETIQTAGAKRTERQQERERLMQDFYTQTREGPLGKTEYTDLNVGKYMTHLLDKGTQEHLPVSPQLRQALRQKLGTELGQEMDSLRVSQQIAEERYKEYLKEAKKSEDSARIHIEPPTIKVYTDLKTYERPSEWGQMSKQASNDDVYRGIKKWIGNTIKEQKCEMDRQVKTIDEIVRMMQRTQEEKGRTDLPLKEQVEKRLQDLEYRDRRTEPLPSIRWEETPKRTTTSDPGVITKSQLRESAKLVKQQIEQALKEVREPEAKRSEKQKATKRLAAALPPPMETRSRNKPWEPKPKAEKATRGETKSAKGRGRATSSTSAKPKEASTSTTTRGRARGTRATSTRARSTSRGQRGTRGQAAGTRAKSAEQQKEKEGESDPEKSESEESDPDNKSESEDEFKSAEDNEVEQDQSGTQTPTRRGQSPDTESRTTRSGKKTARTPQKKREESEARAPVTRSRTRTTTESRSKKDSESKDKEEKPKEDDTINIIKALLRLN